MEILLNIVEYCLLNVVFLIFFKDFVYYNKQDINKIIIINKIKTINKILIIFSGWLTEEKEEEREREKKRKIYGNSIALLKQRRTEIRVGRRDSITWYYLGAKLSISELYSCLTMILTRYLRLLKNLDRL